jgi:hypothetical protein
VRKETSTEPLGGRNKKKDVKEGIKEQTQEREPENVFRPHPFRK